MQLAGKVESFPENEPLESFHEIKSLRCHQPILGKTVTAEAGPTTNPSIVATITTSSSLKAFHRARGLNDQIVLVLRLRIFQGG